MDFGYTLTFRGDTVILLQEKSNDSGTNILSFTYVAPLDTMSSRKLYQLLQDIDLPTLKPHYFVSWTDDRTADLRFRFDNNKVGHIEDYGEIGTYGLIALYDMFDQFRRTLPWIRTNNR